MMCRQTEQREEINVGEAELRTNRWNERHERMNAGMPVWKNEEYIW